MISLPLRNLWDVPVLQELPPTHTHTHTHKHTQAHASAKSSFSVTLVVSFLSLCFKIAVIFFLLENSLSENNYQLKSCFCDFPWTHCYWIGFDCCFILFLLLALSQLSPLAHLHVVGMLRFMFLTKSNRACPLLFNVFLCLFLSYGPFSCISSHKFSRQLSAFSLCSSGLISALLVLSTTYLVMKVSFSPDVILCG